MKYKYARGVYCTVMFLLDAHMCVLVPCVSVWVLMLGFIWGCVLENACLSNCIPQAYLYWIWPRHFILNITMNFLSLKRLCVCSVLQKLKQQPHPSPEKWLLHWLALTGQTVSKWDHFVFIIILICTFFSGHALIWSVFILDLSRSSRLQHAETGA